MHQKAPEIIKKKIRQLLESPLKLNSDQIWPFLKAALLSRYTDASFYQSSRFRWEVIIASKTGQTQESGLSGTALANICLFVFLCKKQTNKQNKTKDYLTWLST